MVYRLISMATMLSKSPLGLSPAWLLSALSTSSLLLLARPVSADVFAADYDAYNNGAFGKVPVQTYVSNPDIISPILQVNRWDADKISPTGGSHIFIRHDLEHSAPIILDARDLSLVYADRQYERTSDVRVQQNFNETFLTFYAGSIVDGHGDGVSLVVDSQYKVAHTVSVQGLRVKNDLHEFQLTGHGTALVTAYEPRRMDLSPWRGRRRGVLLDSIFQEIDLATQQVRFEWRASDHVDPGDSFYRLEAKWDFFHINSVQKSRDGNYLVSARHMHSIYLVDGRSGAILWTLGGKKNQFDELPAAATATAASTSSDPLLSFSWQHHARFAPADENELTFFDNHALTTAHGCTRDCSRGLHVRLDHAATPPTARIVREFRHPRSLRAQSQGSVQPLAGGNVFVGWGRCPSFTEHGADGEAVMEVQFSPWHSRDNTVTLDNYRAFRMDWRATPPWAPDVMARWHDDGDDDGDGDGSRVLSVYASWNGATEVKAWAFLASNESSDLTGPDKVVGIVSREGFETSLALAYPARYARAAALDADWNVLASSGVVDTARRHVLSDAQPVVAAVLKRPGGVLEAPDSSYTALVAAFPGQIAVVLGVPVGWPSVLAGVLLVALWAAARYY